MPTLSTESLTQIEIKAANGKISEWRACYERFGAKLAAQMPAGVAISPDVAKLVNLVELERAGAAVDQAYTANAGREAIAFASASDAWYARTKKYVISMEKVLHDESVRRQRELDDTQQRMHAVVTGPRK